MKTSTFTSSSLSSKALVAMLALASSALFAQTVEVKDAWVRNTVQGQKGTGAFMKITPKADTQLVSVSTPAAGIAEVHEMKMDGDIMRMRALPGLALQAGKTVELKPGSYHVMLMDLKQALPKDSTIPMTLRFKDAKGVESKVELSVPVSAVAPGASAANQKSGDHGEHADHSQHKH